MGKGINSNMDFFNLVGKPYKDGAFGPDFFDCYGLVRFVWHEALGIDLPENTIGWRKFGTLLPWPCELQIYDILMFESLNVVDHIGVAISTGEFLHANRLADQVVQEPISRYKDKLRTLGRANQ